MRGCAPASNSSTYRSIAYVAVSLWFITSGGPRFIVGPFFALITSVVLLAASSIARTATKQASKIYRVKELSPTGDKVLLDGTEERGGGPVDRQARCQTPTNEDGDGRHEELHHLHLLCHGIFRGRGGLGL